jgi:glutamine synthetase
MAFQGSALLSSAMPIPGRGGHCCVTYVWMAAGDLSAGGDVRALTRVLDHVPTDISQVPVASCDGSHTGQAQREFSSLFLQPRALYQDPFRGAPHICVLCDTCEAGGTSNGAPPLRPHPTNNRTPCEAVMQAAASQEPTFVIEQEYTIVDPETKRPLGESLIAAGSVA